MTHKKSPGIARSTRNSEDSLSRLQKQLHAGMGISKPVLAQWIRRYGDSAKDIIIKYDYYSIELQALVDLQQEKPE